MQVKIERFTNMPNSGKVGLALWLVSWIWFIAICHYLFHDSKLVTQLSIAACLLGVFIFQAQNWARMISILANALGLVYSGFLFLIGLPAISIINVISFVSLILFGSSIFFLMAPATSQYFKAQSQRQAP